MQLFGWNITRAKSGANKTVESEPTPTEAGRALAPAPTYGEEAKLVELVNRRALDAGMQRRTAEREWVLAAAFYEDRQWLGWDDTAHRALDLMADDRIERDRYEQRNLVRPLIDKLTALATMTKPDAAPAPESEAPRDRAAAAEGRIITAHLSRLHERPIQTLEATWWASVCGVCYLNEYWDKDARANVAVPGSNGETVRKVSAPVGEVCSDIVPPFGILIDPRARRWNKARWIIHDETLETATIKERYNVDVEPDQGRNVGNWFDSYLPDGFQFGGIMVGGNDNASSLNRVARVLKMYEKPTPLYPEGRLIICTRDRLLYAGPMPLTDKNQFPYARLVYKEAAAHPYGLGLMRSLIPIQIGLNRLLTKATCEVEDNKATLLVDKMSGIGADAYSDDDPIEEKRAYRIVHYNAGDTPPTWQNQPAVSGDVYRLIDIAWLHMQHIAGIHDVNLGGTPTGLTAGISIELLQQGDRTQLGLFTQGIEQFAVNRDQLDISLYAQFAAPYVPRMMGLDDSGNPAVAQMQVMAFQALTAGGACKMIVRPGSATPKSSAGETQEVMEFLKAGLLDPMNPAAETAWMLLSRPKSDVIVETMRRQREEIAQAQAEAQANQPQPPDPAQVEQLRQEGAMQTEAARQQAETQKLVIQQQAQAEENAQAAQLEMQKASHQANLNAQTEMLKNALEIHKQRMAPPPMKGKIGTPSFKKKEKK